MPMMQPRMMRIKEAAQETGVPVHALRVWIDQGSVHAVRSGSRYYVNLVSLLSFLNGGEQSAKSEKAR